MARATAAKPETAAAVNASPHALIAGAGGRETQPTNFNPFAGMPYAFVSRRLLSGLDLSKLSVKQTAPWQLMQILADSHTDVGLALWNVLRLGSRGFSYTVKDMAGKDDPAGKQILDNLLPKINKKSGGVRALHKQWLLSWYLYGGICGELALTEDLRDVLDIYTVNPFTIFFRRDADTQNLVMYQQQTYRPTGDAWNAVSSDAAKLATSGYRLLNDNLVYYTPCDPAIDDPYGRAPAGTVINEVFFDVGLLYDLQKVVHGVGAPRYVITIIEEIAAKTCPANIKNDPVKYSQWLGKILADTSAMFKALPSDEAIALFDTAKVEVLSAKSSQNIMGLADTLSRVIERRIIKSLKMLPLLMGSNEATTETHGSVQFEVFAEAIADAQGCISEMNSQMFTTILALYGRQCVVTCEFENIKTANRLIDANAEGKEILNAAMKEALGYQTHDESSIEVTGSAAVGPPVAGVMENVLPIATPPNESAPAVVRSAAQIDAHIETTFKRLIGQWEQERTDERT